MKKETFDRALDIDNELDSLKQELDDIADIRDAFKNYDKLKQERPDVPFPYIDLRVIVMTSTSKEDQTFMQFAEPYMPFSFRQLVDMYEKNILDLIAKKEEEFNNLKDE